MATKDINLKGFDEDLYWAMKERAAKERTSVKELVTRVMKQYIERKEGEAHGKSKKKGR